MLTRTTKFDNFQYRDTPSRWIIKIVDGSDTYYMVEQDYGPPLLNNGYPVLLSVKGISQEVDIFTSRVKYATVTMTFDNSPVDPTDPAVCRLSDIWNNLGRATVDIYIKADPEWLTLTDCLHVFSGIVSGPPEFTRETVTLKASDNNRLVHKRLPQTYVYEIYPNAPLENLYKRIPVQYGDFTFRGTKEDRCLNGNGPAPCVRIGDGLFVIADHIIYATETAWMQVPALGGLLAELDYNWSVLSMTENDSGRGTCSIRTDDGSYNRAYASLYPAGVGTNNDADDPINACADDDQYALVAASGDTLEVKFLDDFGPGDDAEGNGVGPIVAVYAQWRGEVPDGASVTGGTFKIWSVDPSTGNYDSVAISIPSTINDWQEKACATAFAWMTSAQGIWWMLYRGKENDKGPIHLQINPTGTPSGGELLHVYAARVQIYFRYEPALVNSIYAEFQGREFGSWIDDADHSNAFNSGDLIEYPPYIIESILVDELGVSISNIDCASFDRAYNESVKMKVSLHTDEIRDSADIIREICSEGMMALHQNPEGLWRMLSWDQPINAATYSYTIIEDGHIEGPEKLKIYKTSWKHIANKVRVYYEYRYGTGKYNKSLLSQNSGSQSKFGTVEGELTLRYLDDDGAEYIAGRMISGGNALFADDWIGVQFRTIGRTYAHLEVGDIVRFRQDSLAPDSKSSLSYWQATDFMIIKKDLDIDGCNFDVLLTPGRLRIDLSGDQIAEGVGSAINPTSVQINDYEPP